MARQDPDITPAGAYFLVSRGSSSIRGKPSAIPPVWISCMP
jgi:hypothetical protein